MSHMVKRKFQIKSLGAIEAVCAARGYGKPEVVGDIATIMIKEFTGAFSFEKPVPVQFNLITGEVGYDHDFTRQVNEFFAAVFAHEVKMKAAKQGHTVAKPQTVNANGRRILRITVEG